MDRCLQAISSFLSGTKLESAHVQHGADFFIPALEKHVGQGVRSAKQRQKVHAGNFVLSMDVCLFPSPRNTNKAVSQKTNSHLL
jgi:hypothetical protein